MEVLISPIFSAFLVLVMGILAYLAMKRKDGEWTKTLPTVKPVFPFGHIMYYVMNRPLKDCPLGAGAVVALFAMSKVCGEKGIFLLKVGLKNVIILSSPETAEVILKSHTEIAKSIFYGPLKKVLGDGLITSRGDEIWKLHRKTINPVFHTKMLERFQDVMSNHAEILVNKMQNMENEEIALGPLLGACTFDIVMEATTGRNLQVQTTGENQVLRSIERFMEIAAQRVYHPWLFPNFIFAHVPIGRESQKHATFTQNYFRSVLNERRKIYLKNLEIEEFQGKDDRPCLLDLLLSQQDRKIASFSDDEIVHELENIAIPGFETTTAALSYAFFMIGNNPKVQEKVHKELDDIFGMDFDREITTQDFLKMKFIECVVKETLRLFPPVPIVARTLKEDVVIEGSKIPRGTDVVVFSPPIHRSEKHYEKPDAFMPERFLSENAQDRHPYAFIPFSAGPRNCIGGGFAARSMRNIIGSVLRRFEIDSVDESDTLHINFATIGKPHKPVLIRVKDRRQKIQEAY